MAYKRTVPAADESRIRFGAYDTRKCAVSNGSASYYDYTNGTLKYAYENNAGFTSLQLTSAGWPAISYIDNTNGDLKYTYKDVSGWHFQVADSDGGGAPSLALTSAGWPAISYFASFYEAFGNLKYTYKDASGWHKQTVDSGVDVGKYSSLRLTTAGWPAISYYDYTNYDLKYAYKSAS